MLTLKRLKVKACRGIFDGPDLDFGSRGLFLLGDNGSGKSSYVDAIEKVLTGKCSSLDTGDAGLSWKIHGKHIKSTTPPEIELVATDGNKEFSITLSSLGFSSEKQVKALLSAACRKSFIMRRRTLLAFINAKPVDRYGAIEDFLRLEKFNEFEEMLKGLQIKARGAILVSENERSVNEAALIQQLQLPMFSYLDKTICLAAVNQILKRTDVATLAQIDEAPIRMGEIAAQLAPFTKMDELEKIQALKYLIQEIPVGGTIVNAYTVYATISRRTEDEEAKLKGHFYQEVLDQGAKWIREDALDQCPLCENRINSDEVVKSVEQRLAKNEALSKLRNERSEAHLAFVGTLKAFSNALVKVQEKWALALGVDFPEPSTSIGELFKMLIKTHIKKEPAELIEQGMATLLGLDFNSSVGALLSAVDSKLKTYPDNERYNLLNNARTALQAIITNWKKFTDASNEISRLNLALAQINRIMDLAKQGRKNAAQELLDQVAKKADEFFQKIHPNESIGAPTLTVPERGSGSIDLTSQFYGKSGDPRGCYSEGHVDSLGLCIFLAIRRLHHSQNPELAILILDDVLHSIDGEHRRATAKLVLDEFKDHQIIITTHDPLWFENLKAAAAGGKFNHLRIANWEIATGPTWGDHMSEYEWLKSPHGLAAKPADRVMKAGRLLEEMLQNLCDGMEASVPFRLRGDYTLDPLWTGFLKKSKSNKEFYAAAEIHLNKIDETRRLRNLVGAHYNLWAQNLTDTESKELSDAIVAFRESVFCSDCGQFIRRIAGLDGVWSCKNEHLKFKANP
jgi:recombinational DNA repair ATPase RecF